MNFDRSADYFMGSLGISHFSPQRRRGRREMRNHTLDLFLAIDRQSDIDTPPRQFRAAGSAFDGRDHAAQRVDLVDVIPRAALDLRSSALDEITAAQRIGRIRHAAFVRDDLLRAQRDGGRKFGRQRPSLVQRIRVQRLRAAQHRRQRLQSPCAPRCCTAAAPSANIPPSACESAAPRSADSSRRSGRAWRSAQMRAPRGTWRSPRRNRCAR
jgi:hypothetical protein